MKFSKEENRVSYHSAECSDVRSVLRTVFRELDYLPPLADQSKPPARERSEPPEEDADQALPGVGVWVDKYKIECEKISDHEKEIKHQHAERVAREPLPNLYVLHQKSTEKCIPKWRMERGLLSRRDLTPAVEQDAGRDGSLWVKNILNRSSCVINTAKADVIQTTPQILLPSPIEGSVQTYSIGGVVACCEKRPATLSQQSEHVDYVLCVPPELNFVNCFVGLAYTKCIRLVNVTKFECRLSISPPKHRELDVEINSPRGLTITSGATVELRIHYKPTTVRVLTDQLVVRVSRGQKLLIPIECYLQPPLLDIVVPSVYPISAKPSLSELSSGVECDVDVVELGARLLGDVHCARLLLRCEAGHTAFFVLTEDAWLQWNLNCLTASGSVVADQFVMWPAWWCGGGLVRACVWCRGDHAGTHETALRVLSLTATHRRLYLLADVLLFKPHHLIIEAQEKDFDICSDADPACEYFVHAGTALPHRALATTVRLVNCSPVTYTYYWGARRWGACFCWEDKASSRGSDDDEVSLCAGAREAKQMAHENPEAYARRNVASEVVEVDPARGEILPHAACVLAVRVRDAGEEPGPHRAVLRWAPVDTTLVLGSARSVCEVLCAELEVWWEVVPLRFAVDPPVVPLYLSRRLQSLGVQLMALKLFGSESTSARWQWASGSHVAPPPLKLSAAQCAATRLTLPLPAPHTRLPDSDTLTLVSENEEWKANCVITRECDTRHPALAPAHSWLGVVLPKTRMQTVFSLRNDTFQYIYFWCEAFRWIGENQPRPACVGRIPCRDCKEMACSCALLAPGRGGLGHGTSADICYSVNAPERDGCVVTLVRARRCDADLCATAGAPGTEARASLAAYRVLAPRLAVRVRACSGCGDHCRAECRLDPGAQHSALGAALLRPSAALVLGRRTCYRLRVTNLTPLPTHVQFHTPLDGTDILGVKFIPNNFRLSGHAEADVRVVLHAGRVCARRLFVCRAEALHAHKPYYLVVDTAIVGQKISLQVPTGGDAVTGEFIIMRRSQRAECENDKSAPSTPEQIFVNEDRKRAFVKANICRCHFQMQYIPPVRRPAPPLPEGEYEAVHIISEPPPLTRVCRCFPHSKPSTPDAPESISLEFFNISLRQVYERRLVLRNESTLTARWRVAVRRWPRARLRSNALHAVQWAGDVCAPGVAMACSPAHGVLGAHAHVELRVQVCADCWGLYADQLLIQVDGVEPMVLDVWIHAVGPPLQFKIQPNYTSSGDLPTLWLSSNDSTRRLIAKNISRADLIVHPYLTHEIERVQDVLPFRLYIRVFDVPAATCPCVTALDPEAAAEDSSSASSCGDADIGVELFLAPDHGPQHHTCYDVQPQECVLKAGDCQEWEVDLSPPPPPEVAAAAVVMFRLQPLNKAGESWHRGPAPPQLVRLRAAERGARVALSCAELVAHICALDLPHDSFLRARKRFQVLNTGNERVNVSLHTSLPWCIVQGKESGAGGGAARKKTTDKCKIIPCEENRSELVTLDLPASSSTEVCVEACVSSVEARPCGGAGGAYEARRRDTTPLHLYDDRHVLQTLPLTLEVDYPVIKIQPTSLDFGLVTDGDSRKTYVTVSHTCKNRSLNLQASIMGPNEFTLWPKSFDVAPGCSERVYIQYTAMWRHGPAECVVCVREGGGGGGGGWCRAEVRVRAAPSLDHRWRAPPHDHTDDTHLLPAALHHYRP